MSDGQCIRGVLFDSGGVLIGPVGGRWNPRYDFEQILLLHHPDVCVERFAEAFAAGEHVLNTHAVVSRADYHRAVLRVLGIQEPSVTLLQALEDPAAGPVVEVFPDARRVLDMLQMRGVRMAVVSDNWSGLQAGYRQLDLERYFDGFVISEEMGCCKPDPRMYAAGSDMLGLQPRECLFVDDDSELVAAAINLGYHGVALIRGGPTPISVPAIESLNEVLAIVAGSTGAGTDD